MAAAITRFRVVSLLEALAFILLLFVAMPMKYGNDEPVMVKIMGPTHGILFILYVVLALDLKSKLRWDGATAFKVIIASVIPFAPFFVERWVRTQAPSGARA